MDAAGKRTTAVESELAGWPQVDREADAALRGHRPTVELTRLPTTAPAREIGLVGLDRLGWHRLEQLCLRDDWRVVAVTDARADRRAAARVSCSQVYDTLEELLAVPNISGVLVTESPRFRTAIIQKCLEARKEVWVEPPLSDDLREVRRLQTYARERHTQLRVLQTRRFEPTYQQALAALNSGRLGALRSIRFVSAEWTSFAGDQGAASCPLTDPVEQFGAHGFDQLLGLVEGDPHWVWARRYTGEDGFLAVIGFTSGITTQIEIRRRARATLHTGWVLEGESASFQNGELISIAGDGELIEEPIQLPPAPADPLVAGLSSLPKDTLAEERRAWLTVGLILAVQKSSLRNAAVRWDEVVGG